MKKERLKLIDVIRGIVLINMIAYHAMWDIVYIYGGKVTWYIGKPGYIWQQGICWLFILLSGFCLHLGRKPVKRGFIIFGAGFLVSMVTVLFMPESRVVFGILTCIGSCMILTALGKNVLKRIPPIIGFATAFCLFCIFRQVNMGFLQFFSQQMILPGWLYHDMITTWLGFPPADFFSTDYFSIFPWIFLYWTGFFVHPLLMKSEGIKKALQVGCRPLEFLGRHSLIIYLLHQPVIYALLYLDMMLDQQILIIKLFGL